MQVPYSCGWHGLRRETGELEHRPMGGVRGWKLAPEDLPKLDELVRQKGDRLVIVGVCEEEL